MEGDRLAPWATPPQFTSAAGDVAARMTAPRAGGGALPFPGPAPSSAPGFVRTVPPVNEVKPPQGTDFIPGDTLTGATALNTPAVVGAVSYQVPFGSIGYVRSLIFHVQQVLPTSRILWAVRVDGAPSPGWQAIPTLPGAIAVWEQAWGPEEVYIEVEPGRTVDVQVTILDGGSYNVGAIMHGWIVPVALANASRAGWGI